jgi:acyl carrier protein
VNIEEKVMRFVANNLGGGSEVKVDTPLFETGVLDSVGIFDLVTFLEAEFGVSIGDELIVPENFESVKAVSDFVRRLQSEG